MEIDRNRNYQYLIKNTYSWCMTNLRLRWTLDGTLDPTQKKDTLIFAYHSILLGFLRGLQTRDCQRVDIDKIVQQLSDWKSGDKLNPTLELFKVQWPHVLLSEINKLSILRALENVIWTWVFTGIVRISSVTKYDQTFMSRQNGYLAREPTLSLFCRPIKRTTYCKMQACLTLEIWITWNFI